MRVHITRKSANRKVGRIPVTTTESASCPEACPLRHAGCYADSGPLALHWRAVDNGTRGGDWQALCDFVAGLPAGQLWRHNQAGDLPGIGDAIDLAMLGQLAVANEGRRGFTYTHKPVAANSAEHTALQWSRQLGFVVNLSGNTVQHADDLMPLGLPVVTLMPIEDTNWKTHTTPAGHTVVRCPAEYRETSCEECQLCAKGERDFIVGFTAHGASKRKVDLIAKG